MIPLRQIRAVFIKEGREILRDRRTLLAMILVPLVAIPALLFFFSLLSLFFLERARDESVQVGLIGVDPAEISDLRELLSLPAHWDLTVTDEVDAVARIQSREWALAINFTGDWKTWRNLSDETSPVTVRISHYEGDLRSMMARETIQGLLQNLRAILIEERWESAGLNPAALHPITVRLANVAADTRVTGAMLGGLLPYLVIMLCLTGAAYPAIDLTAGEKERGTLETILTSPVDRNALILGKFGIVLLVAVGTVFFALVSIGVSFTLATHALRVGWVSSASLNFLPTLDRHALIGVFVLLLPSAAFFASLLLCLSLLARSFREAQTYLSPVYLLALLPAMITTLPGVQLGGILVFIPIVNVCLIAREILLGSYPWGPIALVVLTNLVATAFFLWLARRWLDRESILFRF